MSRRSFFKFHLPEDFMRTLSRERYYNVMHYVRYLRWSISKKINWSAFEKHIQDSLLYGASKISMKDLLKKPT